MLEIKTESGRTLIAVLPKEGAYETTFYSKMRQFASQADVIRRLHSKSPVLIDERYRDFQQLSVLVKQ
jgi:hypothetical protein